MVDETKYNFGTLLASTDDKNILKFFKIKNILQQSTFFIIIIY